MDLPFFESVIAQVCDYTREVACHVMGDPLTHPNLEAYLDIIERYGLQAILTTSGYFLKKQPYHTLFHPCVKQINISLNSYNRNDTALTFEQYITPILDLCHQKRERGSRCFINLRVWNLDEAMSERRFNATLFDTLSKAFNVPLLLEDIYTRRPRSIRLAEKILIHFDTYFEWPSLDNPLYGDGTCQGLSSHIGILADGRVVPCCLDGDGIITLGNLHTSSLYDILVSQRAAAMKKGFENGKAVEELCQKCSYKKRFDKTDADL
jgi:radical SAM protein with 4Fe4S-binding SPASM domain